jgi:hypothetical protein
MAPIRRGKPATFNDVLLLAAVKELLPWPSPIVAPAAMYVADRHQNSSERSSR